MFSSPKEILEYYSISNLKDYGNEIAFSCNFHGLDEHPSASMNAVTGLWMCQTCGMKGNTEKFIALQEGCGLEEAQNILENKEHASATLLNLLDKVKLANMKGGKNLINKDVLRNFRFRHPYILRRGFDEKILRLFKVGFNKESQRITIPCFDEDENLTGLVERSVHSHQKPKYLYSKGFKKKEALFGINIAKISKRGKAVLLCEGPLDAIKSYQCGQRAVASLGATLSHQQFNQIQGYFREVIFCPDNDEGGHGFLSQCSKALNKGFGVNWKFMKLPNGKKDVCELNKNEFIESMNKSLNFTIGELESINLRRMK